MKDLIEALQIFAKYIDDEKQRRPTACHQTMLFINYIGKDTLSEADRERVEVLGFYWDDDYESYLSDRFGC